jgi:hypothetical protein
MTIVSRLQLDHPALDDPGGNALHTQVEDLYIKIGDNLSARYFEVISLADSGTTTLTHNFKMPFEELAFKIYALAGAGGELTVTDETQYDIVATTGTETTQIDVTNNTGGVSTFAVLTQSLGGAGGQTSYTIVVDAAGEGDYLTIKEGVEAASSGDTVYIRNGTYNEGSVSILTPPGVNIIGESHGGVLIQFSGTGYLFNGSGHTNVNDWSRRVAATNRGWQTTGSVGTLTVNQGSTSASYIGDTAPPVNSRMLIGGNPNVFVAVASGGGSITLDRAWQGGSATEVPVFVLDATSDVYLSPTVWKNFRVETSGTGNDSGVISFFGFYNYLVENITIISTKGDGGKGCLDNIWCWNTTFRNIKAEYRGSSFTVKFMDSEKNAYLKLEDIQLDGFNAEDYGSAVYCDFHFSRVAGKAVALIENSATTEMFYRCKFQWDVLVTALGGQQLFNYSASRNNFAECHIIIGQTPGSIGTHCSIPGFDNTMEFRNWNLTGSLGQQTFTIQGSDFAKWQNTHIRAGNAFYKDQAYIGSDCIIETTSESGTPTFDGRTAPPPELYDIVIDASGNGDYTEIGTGVQAATAGQSVYIRNGSYSEISTTNVAVGVTITGESRDGVVLTNSNTGLDGVFDMPNGTYEDARSTTRTGNNKEFDTTQSCGTATVTANSNIVSYNGPNDPAIGYYTTIGSDPRLYEIVAVDGGLNQFTIDHPWEKGAESGLPLTMFSALPGGVDARNEIRNMTIISSATNANGRVFRAADTLMNLHVSNCNIQVNAISNGSAGKILYGGKKIWNCSFTDCTIEQNAPDTGLHMPFYAPFGFQHINTKKVVMVGFREMATSNFSWFNHWHFSHLGINDGSFIRSQLGNFFNYGSIIVDSLSGGASANLLMDVQAIDTFVGNTIKVGEAKGGVNAYSRGSQNILSFGNWDSTGDIGMSVHTITTADKDINTLTDTISNTAGDIYANNSVLSDTFLVTETGTIDGTPIRDNRQGVSAAPVYDIVVDAAGNGDYTTVFAGLNAATAGQTIYVRNGTYAETSNPILKNGCTLLGESRSGVILQNTGAQILTIGNGNNYGSNARTQLNTNRDDWDAAAGLGTVTCTNNSATVSYTGPSLPAAGGFLQIGSHDPVEILSVSAPNITLVNNWTGPSLSGVDANYFTGFLDLPTRVQNLTIEAVGNQAGVYHQWNIYGVDYKDVSFTTTATAISYPCMSFNGNASNIVVDDCSFKSLATSGTTQTCVIRVNIAAQNITFKDCYSENLSDNYFNGNATNPQKYINWHFKRITGASDEIFQQLFVVHSNFRVDEIDNCFGWWSRNFTTWEPQLKCNFKFGTVTNMGGGQFDIIGKLNVIDVGFLDGPLEVQAQSATGTFRNIITTGLVNGFMSVDDSVVIGGGVAYDSIGGTPASNNGHEF